MCRFWKKILYVFCSVTLSVSLKFVEKGAQRPKLQVHTSNGIVQGIRLSSDATRNGYYYGYMGIPFAEPPVGNLRFKAPIWAKNWTGVLDGSNHGSDCVQISIRSKSTSRVTGKEDCLFINVFTKHNPRKSKRSRPVMVFFYGGAFLEGTSDPTDYGPDLLVSMDVILVSFNYRTGIFGFLNTEDLASPGNYGLKDQNLALRWVRRNIKKFGGDPENVTIFGQSAGSVSVHFHLLSPKSRGLFHKAIMESGSVLCHWGSQRKPLQIASLVGVSNGITNPKNNQELVDRLRQIPLEQFRTTLLMATLAAVGTGTLFGLPYSPSVEPEHKDAFITKDYWYEMLKKGEFNKVPIMMGITSNETLFFLRVIRLVQPFLSAYDVDPSFATPPALNISNAKLKKEIGMMVRDRYIGTEGKFRTTQIENLIRFTTIDYFTRPIVKTAMLMAKYVPLYFYYFSYEGIFGSRGINEEAFHPQFRGVAHVEELYYIFNKLGNLSKKKADFTVRSRMLDLWTNFAQYGSPTPKKEKLLGNLIWPIADPSENSRMNYLEINETMRIRDSFNEQEDLDWWEDIFSKYSTPPLRTY